MNMKRKYIKPEMEELVSESEGILCASNPVTQWGTNTGGKTQLIGDGEPDPSGTREDGFFEDEEY